MQTGSSSSIKPLPQKIKWKAPKAYLDANKGKVFSETKAILINKILGGIIASVLTAYVFDLIREKQWLMVAVVLIALILVSKVFINSNRIISIASDIVMSPESLTLDVNDIKWNTINWYQPADVEGYPGLRAIEINFKNGDRAQTLPLVFDPKDVNEQEVLAYIREAINQNFEDQTNSRSSVLKR